jgi:transposase-like protein
MFEALFWRDCGASYHAIAKLLGISPKTARSWVYLARRDKRARSTGAIPPKMP